MTGGERRAHIGAGAGAPTTEAMLAQLTAWAPHAAVVVGSGMRALTACLTVEAEIGYEHLRWPRTAVPGHDNLLRLARGRTAGGRELRLALACGRPHRYEGWDDEDLGRAVRDLAACGIRRLLTTHASGGLGSTPPRTIVVCRDVVDLQTPPPGAQPPRLAVCTTQEAARVATSLRETGVAASDSTAARAGVYVCLSGPHYETPAEARWLARYGDAVGMSAAPEVRAARVSGMTCLVLALVVNRSGEDTCHDDVVAVAASLSQHLAQDMVPLLTARWPELA